MTIRALKALKVPKVPTNVQKTLRAKELKDKTGKPAQRKNNTKKVVGEARRKAQTADRGDKTQAVAKKVLPEVTKVRKKVEGMTIDQLSTKFTGKELKAMEMKLKQASKPNQALLNKLSKARDQRTGMVGAIETPSDRPQSTPAKFRKKGGMVKRKGGGNLKPVDAKKNPGLAQLPESVRNTMGFAKKGKQVKKAMQKGKVIKANMSGDDLVRSCYD
jgi:hypothetical protein